jgi:hypothetical protein
MSNQVVTELVIDSDTSGADRYESAMSRAGASAKGANSANDNLALSIAGVGVGMLAVVASITQGIDHIVKLNKSLADMQTMAKQVGLSLADLQGIQFGGAVAGLDERTINAGLEKSAQLLNDAQRNANSLSKEFAANGLSIKNANGQLISQNQLLGIAADLVKRAQSPGDQLAIAQMLGFTKEWIPLLEQGKGAMSGLTAEAQKAGAVIDDETINRATEFDRQWRKSSVEFSSYMKSALLSLLPYLDDLIERAKAFVKTIDVDKIEKSANEQLKALADPIGLPNEAGLTIHITPEAKAAVDEIANASNLWESWVRLMGAFAANKPIASVSSVGPEDMKWFNGTGTSVTDQNAAKNTAIWLAEGNAWKKLSADMLTGADVISGGFSKVASRGDDANDAVDRAINTLQRHILQQQADTKAVGLGAGALAGFRADAAEAAAVLANTGKETDEQRERFSKLRAEAIATADSLARVKVASEIDFARKTAFLSPDDVAIANKLKEIYGNDVPAALASTEASAMRVNNVMKDLGDSFREVGKSAFSAFLSGKNVMDAMVQSLDNVAKETRRQSVREYLEGR